MKPFFSHQYRHFQRYREIISILSKHGFGHLLESLGIVNVLKYPWPKKVVKSNHLGIATRLRRVLEELGPTFIKLGQILSTRPDLLPEEYLSQLELLQDQANPIDFIQIKQCLEETLRKPLDKLFRHFNETPIASASIGQVHEARLLTGEHVVVKVQRMAIEHTIETDLEILGDVAGILESRTDWGKHYRIKGLVEEFAASIRDELDYIMEAKNADRFRANLAGDMAVRIPEIYWEYSSRRILVMGYVSGIKINFLSGLEKLGVQKSQLAKQLTNLFFKQMLIDGFFHADPHPGNIAVDQNSVIIMLDFGMVGRLDEWLKDRLGWVIIGIIRKDLHMIANVLRDFGYVTSKNNENQLLRDLHYLFDKYYYSSLKDIKLSSMLRDLSGLMLRYRIRVPQEIALIGRCLILLEHVVEILDPGTSVIELAKPFGPKLLMEKLAPRNWSKSIIGYLLELANITIKLPGKIDHILQLITDGELKVILEHHNFDNFTTRLTVLGNRLSFSLIIAATIIGSSLIALKTPESIFGHFPIAEAGFIVAVLMGIWLLISIIRSGRI